MRYCPRFPLLLLLVVLFAGPASAQAQAPAAAAAAPPRNADYVLGTGDTLKVTVFDEPGLTKTGLRIDADGTFEFPLLDPRVKAAGRTTAEIRDEIQKRLLNFVKSPQVTVEVDGFRPRQASVVGQVRQPGRITLNGQMTLLEALAQVGYLTPEAGNEIQVVHESDTPGAKGATTRVVVADMQLNKPEANIVLREGDLIIVAEKQKFVVSGLVRQPNQYTWERGMTVRIALALAGGISEKGSNRGITVHRKVNGKVERKNIEQDDLVEPDDIIEVRQRRL